MIGSLANSDMSFQFPLVPGAFFLALASSFALARLGPRFLMDVPRARSSHLHAVPRGGGICFPCILILVACRVPLPGWLWIPVFLVSLTGFVDDLVSLRPSIRLATQLFMTAAVTWGLFIGGPDSLLLLLLVPVALYLVGSANFYNFMDGINGMAVLNALFAYAALGALALSEGRGALAVLFFGSAAGALGFLPFNLPRARLFMGDVGSLYLGFLFAAGVCLLATDLWSFLALCSFLFFFYADCLSTLWIRRRDGESLTQAHRRHLYQILVNERGLPHWRVAIVYAAGNLFAGSLSWAAFIFELHLVQVIFASLLLWFFLRMSFRIRAELRGALK